MTSKLHLACDGRGGRLSVVLSPGQRHESIQLEAVLDAICVKRPGGVGRPSKHPTRLIADRGYNYLSCRLLLRRRGIRHTIPERRDQREHRAVRPPRGTRCDSERLLDLRQGAYALGGELQRQQGQARRLHRSTAVRASLALRDRGLRRLPGLGEHAHLPELGQLHGQSAAAPYHLSSLPNAWPRGSSA
jgi:hypothetical protein